MTLSKSSSSSRMTREQLAPYVIPIAIVGITVITVIVALILLSISVVLQIEAGANLLGTNLSDQTRTFVQLQRETLRMLNEVTKPIDELDISLAETQYQLLISRVNHMNGAARTIAIPVVVAQHAAALNTLWEDISGDIEAWLANPQDTELRSTVTTALTEFERQANAAEIEFNRSRTLTLSEFATTSRQIPITFGFATIALIALISAVLFGVYSYIREAQAAEAARQSSQFKDQFLAVMSHELRTPLNAIIGFLGIMKMGGGMSEKQLHMVDRSRANAERLLMLIDDILDISKIEAGRFEINPESVELRELFARWKSQTEVLASQKGIDFKLNIDESLPKEVTVDADALTKIVTNLLSNAFKFTAQGSVNLTVRAAADRWKIEVSDTGIGIPADKHEQIFESFRQVDSSTRRAYGGTGLGLSIVKQLTNLLKGEIEVQSELGKGSRFTVILPLVLPEIADANLNEVQELDNAYSK